MTDREKEAFIGGIEFARDWNLDIPPDDLRLYERLIQERTEKEISGIIETAADKATVNPDVTKPEKPKEPEMKIETTAEAFVEAVLQMGTTLQQAKTAILKMSSSRDAENRKNTNNWRKMHGLPMRRKQKARKKHERGKGADGH